MEVSANQRLAAISKDSCILVEFMNDFDDEGKNLIGVGFTNWLDENTETDVTVLNININDQSEHLIHWPENVEVLNFSKKTIQCLTTCHYKQTPIKIIAHGTWDEMKNKRSNLEKFDQPETPDKSSRHNHKRKEFGNSFETVDSGKSDSKRVKIPELTKGSKGFKTEEDAKLKSMIDQNTKSSKGIYSSDTSEDEFEAELTEKNKLIEKKNEEINTMSKVVSDQLKEIDTLKIKNEKLECKVTKLEKVLEKQKNIDLHAQINDWKKIKEIADFRLMAMKNEQQPLTEVTNHNRSIRNEDYDSDDNSQTDENGEKLLKRKKEERNKGKLNEYHNPYNIRANALLPTKYEISKDIIDSVSRKKIKDATYILLKKCFTKEELAQSSCTGKGCNSSDEIPAKALDIEKFNAIRNVIYEIHHEKQDKWGTLFMTAAKNLIGSSRKK